MDFLQHISSLLSTPSAALTQQLESLSLTHIHTWMTEGAMEGANGSSGAIWGSVSCLKQPGEPGIRTSDCPMTGLLYLMRYSITLYQKSPSYLLLMVLKYQTLINN